MYSIVGRDVFPGSRAAAKVPRSQAVSTARASTKNLKPKKMKKQTSLVVQWPRRQAPNAGGPGSITGPGTKSHLLCNYDATQSTTLDIKKGKKKHPRHAACKQGGGEQKREGVRLLYMRSESWEGVGRLFLSRTLSPCSAFLIYGDVPLGLKIKLHFKGPQVTWKMSLFCFHC